MRKYNANKISVFAGISTIAIVSFFLLSSKSANTKQWTTSEDEGIVIVKNHEAVLI